MQETELEIDRDAVRRYFMAVLVLACIVLPLTLAFIVIMLIVVVNVDQNFDQLRSVIWHGVGFGVFFVIVFAYGCWLCPRTANSLRYRLVGSTLRTDEGVFILNRKSIPLERIMDVVLVQGPLLRFFNIWTMQIKTVGSPMPEATLYGVREPENIREMILAQRRNACCGNPEDT